MAPFSEQCSTETLGPCALNAVELASNSFEVIELNEAAVLPAVQARESNDQLSDLRDRFQLSRGAQGDPDEKSEQSDATSVYLESVATSRVRRADSSAQADLWDGGSPPELPDYTPESELLASETADMQLVWGRFGFNGA